MTRISTQTAMTSHKVNTHMRSHGWGEEGMGLIVWLGCVHVGEGRAGHCQGVLGVFHVRGFGVHWVKQGRARRGGGGARSTKVPFRPAADLYLYSPCPQINCRSWRHAC